MLESHKERRKLYAWMVLPCLVLMSNFSVLAADVDLSREIISKYQIIEELKKEIAQIDSENIRCQKMKKGWIAATVVGGVGVVATGTSAVIQASKLKDKPKSKKQPTSENGSEQQSETAEQ